MLSCHQVPAAPVGVFRSYYAIRCESPEDYSRFYTYHHPFTNYTVGEELSYTLNNLKRDTEYSVRISMNIIDSACPYMYIYRNFSDPVFFRTNATRKLLTLVHTMVINCQVENLYVVYQAMTLTILFHMSLMS